VDRFVTQPDPSSVGRFFNAVFPCRGVEEYCQRATAEWARITGDDSPAPVVLRIAFLPFDQSHVRVVGAEGALSVDRLPGESSEHSLRRALQLGPEAICFPVYVEQVIVAAITTVGVEESPSVEDWFELIAAGLKQCAVQEAEARRRHLEAMAEFAAGAGHEINNPAATIVGRTQQLLRDESDPERRRILATIGAQAYRIRDMIGDAMLFARPPRPQKQALDLGPAISQAIQSVHDGQSRGVTLEAANLSEDLMLDADPVQLQVVLCELLRNAVEASSAGQTVRVSTGRGPTGLAEILVEDEGRGLSETEREHLFDPFFSGRQAGRGLGFGLPKAWRIVQQHRGLLTVQASEGSTRFRVLWPIAKASGGRQPPEAV
jgi:signal transduction histidine kinase